MLKLDSERKDIVDSTMIMNSVEPTKNTVNSKQLHKDMQIAINNQWNEEFWNYLLKTYPEKLIINCFFNGNRGYFELMKKSMIDELMEDELISNGMHPYFITKEDAMMFHSTEKGSYKQVMLSDKNPLGTTNYSGEVHLIKSNIIKNFSIKSLQSYFYEECNLIVPIPDVKKQLKTINRQFDEFNKRGFTTGEDVTNRRVREQVQIRSKERKLSREETNIQMQKARKYVDALSQQMARAVVNLVFSEGTELEEKYRNKLLTLIIKNFITGTELEEKYRNNLIQTITNTFNTKTKSEKKLVDKILEGINNNFIIPFQETGTLLSKRTKK